MRRGPLHVPLVLLVMVLGACVARGGDGGGPAPAPAPVTTTAAPGALPGPVVVRRGGGIAGVRDTVVVRPDGSWERTSATGSGRDGTGRLDAGELARLAALVADPRLAAEAGRTAVPATCADGFSYGVEAGGTRVSFVECGRAAERPPVAYAIVGLVLPATQR